MDEDRSALSARITGAFYPPHFLPPVVIDAYEMDARMDAGLDTFALDIPPEFQRDVLAGRSPTIQLNVDATRAVLLFLAGAALHLFATTSLGIFLATVGRTMPRFGLLLILVLLPLELLSGGTTPRESMPALVQTVMLGAPTTHFVMLAQAILFRAAGLEVVRPSFRR